MRQFTRTVGLVHQDIQFRNRARLARTQPLSRLNAGKTPRDHCLLRKKFVGSGPPLRRGLDPQSFAFGPDRAAWKVLSMRWQDVDLEAGWWTIPASQAKKVCPPCSFKRMWAVDILTNLRIIANNGLGTSASAGQNREPKELSKWVFVSSRAEEPVAWIQGNKRIRVLRGLISGRTIFDALPRNCGRHGTATGRVRFSTITSQA
ncbi:MAG: hypothetical protein Udaeo2_22950 [Candidatus Udaeobacter sp.]|nr:MAG: hypothetical protein Udaeo2_22950 [Candidatus Udaeobacter sp.]